MKRKRLHWIERALSFVSPSLAYERAAWRDALKRSYDSGNSERLNSGWVVANQPAEQANQTYRDTIRARARDLERNSDVAESIIGALVRNVVGTGNKLQAKTDDDALNAQIESLWLNWSKAKNCDLSGRFTFPDMQRLTVRRSVVDGGILFVKNYKSDGVFALQIREVDDIDYSMNLSNSPNKNRIINGIEVDKYNKPIAYYLKTVTPDGLWTGTSQRISADRIIHLFDAIRPSQIREISKLAITANRIRDINEFVEAESVKARILACLSVFIKKLIPTGGGLGRASGVTTDSKSGYTEKTLAPGMIEELNPGDEVQFLNPSGQASNVREFVQTQIRLGGSGQGLSYETVARDMSQVNYSSARQGQLEDRKTYEIWQQKIIDFCDEIYEEFLKSVVLAGNLSIPDFWQNPEKYLKHEFIPAGWSWIDPLKEVKANEIALNTGQTTLAQICASSGQDWKDILSQKAKEKELAEKLNLKLGDNSDVTITEGNSDQNN